MNVDSIKRQTFATDNQQTSAKRQTEQSQTSEARFRQRPDRLDISQDARLKSIQSKTNSGFYNKPEIIKDVAKKRNTELPQVNKQSQ